MTRPRARGWLPAVLAAGLAVAACKKDEVVVRTCDDIDALAAQIVQTVHDAEDPSAGVAAARELLDARKAELSAKVAEMGRLRSAELTEDAQRRMVQTLLTAPTTVDQLRLDYASESVADHELQLELDALTTDFAELLRP